MDYTRSLDELRSQLAISHSGRLVEFDTLEARLRGNDEAARLYGETETTRAERSRILEALDRLSLETIRKRFPPPEKAHSLGLVNGVLYFLTQQREMDVYLENLLSDSGLPNTLGRMTGQHLVDICATLKLVESPDATNTLPSARQMEIEDALMQTRRMVILGEPGSGKTTLLKLCAMKLVGRDQTLHKVIRSLSPGSLHMLTARLRKKLLYLSYASANNVTSLKLLLNIVVVLLIATVVCIVLPAPGLWVNILKQPPMSVEGQRILHAEALFLGIATSVFLALVCAWTWFLMWADDRARLNRLMMNLEARSTDTWPLPIVVRLSEVAQHRVDLTDYLVYHIQSRGLHHSRSELERLLRKGRVWLLLDGLDETGSRRLYLEVQQLVSDFARKYPRASVIVTCRTSAFHRHSMSDFSRYSIQALDDDQIRRIVERWFPETPELGTDLLNRLQSTPRLLMMAKNPLLLSIMLMVFENARYLPQKREALYQACVQSMLGSRASIPMPSHTIDTEWVLQTLAEVAYESHRKGRLSFLETEIRPCLATVFPSDESAFLWLEEIETHTGLIHRVSKTEYSFRHLAFQEYFASLAIANRPDRIQQLSGHIAESWWREIIVLLVCHVDSSPVLRAAMVKASHDSTEGMMLALACLNEGAELPPDLRGQIVDTAIKWLHTSPDYSRLTEIGRLDSGLESELWGEIADWFHDIDPLLRCKALDLCTMVSSDRALPAVISLTVSDPDVQVRKKAVTALTKIDVGSAIEQLVAAVCTSSDFEQRRRATVAIARLGERACERLIGLVNRRDLKSQIRVSVAESLDSIMVEVPAGEFTMGDNAGDSDTAPTHVVRLGAFWIDKYEVTNAQYARFVRTTGYRVPRHWRHGTYASGTEGFPVTFVSWHDAQAYATWAGKRLPTEAEWEKAARGSDGRRYPWGSDFEADRCNWFEAPNGGQLAAVGSFPVGVSPYGACDMAGNVWEWVEDWYQPYPGSLYQSEDFGQKTKVMRGGSESSIRELDLRCASRLQGEPDRQWSNVGFRCACDRSPLEG